MFHALSHARWSLGDTLSALPHLTRLVVSDNALDGALPASGYEQLDVFDVQGNQFDYPPPSLLSSLCVSGRLACGGVGVTSCQAFGDAYTVRIDSPEECIKCEAPIYSALALSGMALLFFGGLATYAYLINRYPTMLKAGVSTASILLTHLQTVSIVVQLRLAWPQSVDAAASYLIVNGLNLQAARPSVPVRPCTLHPLPPCYSLAGSAARVPGG